MMEQSIDSTEDSHSLSHAFAENFLTDEKSRLKHLSQFYISKSATKVDLKQVKTSMTEIEHLLAADLPETSTAVSDTGIIVPN